MFAPLRRFQYDGSLRLEVRVEEGVGNFCHFPVAGSIDRSPHCASPFSLLSKRDNDFLSVLLDIELEGRKESACVVGKSGDIKDAAFPVVGQLNAGHVFTLLGEPLHHLRDSDSPLRWDSTLSRKVEGEIP